MESPAVAELLRGPKGTQVKVSVKREGATEPYTATITRGGIETSVVDAFWVRPGIVYLGVTSFEAQNISRDTETFMQKLGEQNVQGLILDLRNNLGGLVTEAVSLAGRFLRNGQTVVSHRGRAEQEQIFRAKANPLAQKYPIVVLVNGQSASASEIVSGALQDHDRAWILGENTFGKGLVQAQFPLSEGAALLLTIAHYYTPSGRPDPARLLAPVVLRVLPAPQREHAGHAGREGDRQRTQGLRRRRHHARREVRRLRS